MYQPKLLPRQIRALYQLKKLTGRPMTHLAREAIDMYLFKKKTSNSRLDDLPAEPR